MQFESGSGENEYARAKEVPIARRAEEWMPGAPEWAWPEAEALIWATQAIEVWARPGAWSWAWAHAEAKVQAATRVEAQAAAQASTSARAGTGADGG